MIIVFDFDGTLADTLDAIVRITNRLSGEFGYQKANQDDVEKLRNLTSWQIIKTTGIPLIKIPFLIQMVKAELNNEIKHLHPVEGMADILAYLNAQGHRLGIITSNSLENVTLFLNNNGWDKFFEFIHSGTTIFGKNQIMHRLIKQENIPKEQLIYIGDETRDIEAAQKLNVKAIAVSWGFNSKEVLAAQKPDFLVDHPREIIGVVEELQQMEPSDDLS